MTYQWNPQHAPPSYEEMGLKKPEAKKPVNPALTKPKPLPVKYAECYKCHKPGGTLVRVDNRYVHPDCSLKES